MKILSLIGAVCLALIPLAGASDIIVMNDGTRLAGRVEKQSEARGRVVFINGTGRLELPSARISEVIEEDDATDWTNVGNQYLEAKNFSTAIQMYQQALEANTDHAPARDGLERAQKAIEAQRSEQERQLQEGLGQELESIPELIQNEQFEAAQSILDRVITGSASEDQLLMARRLMRDLHLAWGFARFDRLDYRGAEEHYLRVVEMDPDNKEARDRLLRIWQRDPSKKPQVLKAYQSKLQEEPDNLEYNRIVGDILYDFERYLESVNHLKKVYASPRFGGMGYDTKLKRAYKEAIRQYEEAGELGQAIGLYEEFLSTFPTEDVTPLTVLRYEQARRQLADQDYTGRAQLVQKLYEAGLTEYASREAELILRYDQENEAALAILRQDAQKRLQRIQQAMTEQNYLVARDMAMEFVRNTTRFPDLVEQAQEYYNRADIEARRLARTNKEQAREIAQRGIQYYNEALNFTTLMKSNEVQTSARPISYKQQAIDKASRAINHYETAIRLDPTLAGIEGMDLNARLRDARALYRGLTDRPAPIPSVRNRTPRN